jgi:hypothetical protein
MTAGGLQLELRVPVERVPLDRDVVVEIALVNRGSEPLLVNGRLLVSESHAPAMLHEVTFEVVGPPDYVNGTLLQINAGKPAPKHFVELGPGEDIVKAFALTNVEDMSVPGSYAVRATYANVVDDPILPRRPWIGRLSSEWKRMERTDA